MKETIWKASCVYDSRVELNRCINAALRNEKYVYKFEITTNVRFDNIKK